MRNDRFTKARRARTLVKHQRTFIVGKVSGRGWPVELHAAGHAVEPSDSGRLGQFPKFPDWPHYPPVTTLELADRIQPAFGFDTEPKQNGREILGNGASLVLTHGSTGPVHQGQIVQEIEGQGEVGSIRLLVSGER